MAVRSKMAVQNQFFWHSSDSIQHFHFSYCIHLMLKKAFQKIQDGGLNVFLRSSPFSSRKLNFQKKNLPKIRNNRYFWIFKLSFLVEKGFNWKKSSAKLFLFSILTNKISPKNKHIFLGKLLILHKIAVNFTY
jgi:hypothetical protein